MEPQPTESRGGAEARDLSHNEPRVQLFVPKEETFSIPLKYIDVARSTHTDLDVMQEKRIDDYWNASTLSLISPMKSLGSIGQVK